MNTFADFWRRMCDRQPPLRDDATKMTMTVESFRKSLQSAYQAGTRDAAAVAREFEKAGRTASPYDDLFGGMFR